MDNEPKFPKIKKKLENFLKDEEGTILRSKAAIVGPVAVGTVLLMSKEMTMTAEANFVSHASHRSHSSGVTGNHVNHVSHVNHSISNPEPTEPSLATLNAMKSPGTNDTINLSSVSEMIMAIQEPPKTTAVDSVTSQVGEVGTDTSMNNE